MNRMQSNFKDERGVTKTKTLANEDLRPGLRPALFRSTKTKNPGTSKTKMLFLTNETMRPGLQAGASWVEKKGGI